MRFAVSAILCLAVWSLMPVQAGAVGKIITDPNASGTQVVKPAREIDNRLAERVTYQAKRKTVCVILSDLSQATGVKLRAGWNEKDWQVRDRKMNIFVKDLPLGQLMNSIARVMKFKWSASEKDKVKTYRLFMDRKSLLDDEAKKARADQRLEEYRVEQRERAVNHFLNADRLSDADLAQMKSDKPYSYWTAKNGMAGGFGKIMKASPSFGEAVVAGQEISINALDLSPEGQQGVMQYINAVKGEHDKLVAVSGEPDAYPIKVPASLAEVTIHYRPGEAFDVNLGRMCVYVGQKDIGMSLLDPNSKLACAVGKARIAEEENTSDEAASTMIESAAAEDTEKLAKVRGETSADDANKAGKQPARKSDDPALQKKVKLTTKGGDCLADVEAAVAESTGLAVVSDSFGRQEIFQGLAGGEVEIGVLLDAVGKASEHGWEKHGDVIEFRDRRWFEKRSAQIPEAWLEPWRKRFTKTGTLKIGDLARIALLNNAQSQLNIRGDEVLSSDNSQEHSVDCVVTGNRAILRACACLADDELSAVFSDSGLNLAAVSPDRRAEIEKTIARGNRAFFENPDAEVVMFGRCVSEGKRLSYTITVKSSKVEAEPTVWKFTTPEYRPPKEDGLAGGKPDVKH